MAEEDATAIQIGKRIYRAYPIKDLIPAEVFLQPRSLSLLDEDDGESEEEENINVDVSDFERFTQEKLVLKQEEVISETIFYRPSAETYTLTTKLPPQCFYQLCGGCSTDRTPVQTQIESETKAQLKGYPSNFTLEIKGNNYQQVVQAHISVLEIFKITPKPTEYQVMSDKLIAVVKGFTQAFDEDSIVVEEVKIEEYPPLEMKYDAKWQGFVTKVMNFPKECADFLLGSKGKVIKQLKAEMKGNVEFNLNKTENCLEIVGYTQEQVKEGYAAFVRVLSRDKAADAFVKLKTPAKGTAKVQRNPGRPLGKERNFTHFLSINLENNSELLALQQTIFSFGIPNFNPNFINPPNRFHITVAVLSLTSPDGVLDCLNSLTSDFQSITQNQAITLTFDRVGYFGKPTAANVIYVDLLHDKEFSKFNQISLKIHQSLMKSGILTQTDLNKQKTELKPTGLKKQYHMTLAKTKGNGLMDVTNPMTSIGKFSIQVQVKSVELMSMFTNSANSSYPIIFSKQII